MKRLVEDLIGMLSLSACAALGGVLALGAGVQAQEARLLQKEVDSVSALRTSRMSSATAGESGSEVDYQLAIRRDPSVEQTRTTPPLCELIPNATRFFLEIWVTSHHPTAGVSCANVDLESIQCLDLDGVEFGDHFPVLQTGSHTRCGAVEAIGACSLASGGVGSGEWVLLAQIALENADECGETEFALEPSPWGTSLYGVGQADPVNFGNSCGMSVTCDDQNACTEDLCDSALGCVYTPQCIEPSDCDDNDDCTSDICTVAGCCLHENICNGICRSPGFWSTHARANPAKPGSQNVTQAVIDAGGGSIEVCGECISATGPVGNAASAIETLCMTPRGAITLQNARQITALALNCIVSGFGPDCSGNPELAEVFSDCNDACVGLPSGRSNLTCRTQIDCLNNGGRVLGNGTCQTGNCANGDPCSDSMHCADGLACSPMPESCHGRPLINGDLGLYFDPPGPAGSEGDCNDAKANSCGLLPLPCTATKNSGEGCCSLDSCP